MILLPKPLHHLLLQHLNLRLLLLRQIRTASPNRVQIKPQPVTNLNGSKFRVWIRPEELQDTGGLAGTGLFGFF